MVAYRFFSISPFHQLTTSADGLNTGLALLPVVFLRRLLNSQKIKDQRSIRPSHPFLGVARLFLRRTATSTGSLKEYGNDNRYQVRLGHTHDSSTYSNDLYTFLSGVICSTTGFFLSSSGVDGAVFHLKDQRSNNKDQRSATTIYCTHWSSLCLNLHLARLSATFSNSSSSALANSFASATVFVLEGRDTVGIR